MTNEEFLATFGHLAAAPGGVGRLRRLILDLAVRGRLVEQVSGERPVIALRDEAEIVMGQAPPGSACNTDGLGTPFVKAGEFADGGPVIREWTTKPLRMAKAGDVLICVVGATSGKVCIGADCAIGRSVAAVRPSPALLQGYLLTLLSVRTPVLRRGARGSAQGVIQKRTLESLPLLLPSLEEQHRIVARVDELMGLCDELEESHRQAETHRGATARSALAAIVESDRSDADRAVRLVEEHVRQCLAPGDGALEVLGQVRGAILDLAVAGRLTDPGAEQTEWERTDLASIVTWAGGSAVPKSVQGSSTGEFLVCKVGDMNRPGNERYIRSTENRISAEVAEDIGARAHGPGTVIFPKIGGAIATNKRRLLVAPTVLDPNCLGVVPRDGVSSEWLFLLMSSIDMARLANSGPIPAVSQRVLGGAPVVLPPPADQERIVARVYDLTALCDEIEANMMRERSLAGDLLQSACTAVVSA